MKKLSIRSLLMACAAFGLVSWANGNSPQLPKAGVASSNNLCAILITQLRPRWEEHSLGQSAATPENVEYHVAVGAASSTLVARQRVFLNSTDGRSAQKELGPDGGIIQLSDVTPGAEVTTVISVEFQPSLGLEAVFQQFKGSAGVAGSIALYQVIADETTCFLDPTGWTRCGDYLTCQVTAADETAQSHTRHLLRTDGCCSRLETAGFFVVRDSKSNSEPVVSIQGRLGGIDARVLGQFTVTELESAGALVPSWLCEKCQFVLRPIRSQKR